MSNQPETEPESSLAFVDGRDALAYVIIRPNGENGVVIEAAANGISQPRAGFVLRHVAKGWERRPTIVCLCGSTRFAAAFREANLAETLAGRIVLSIGCDMRSDAELFAGLDDAEISQIKTRLDELHKRKIDLADEVLVLNVGGYVGDSTRSEIAYAEQLGKPIRWLEPAAPANIVPHPSRPQPAAVPAVEEAK